MNMTIKPLSPSETPPNKIGIIIIRIINKFIIKDVLKNLLFKLHFLNAEKQSINVVIINRAIIITMGLNIKKDRNNKNSPIGISIKKIIVFVK